MFIPTFAQYLPALTPSEIGLISKSGLGDYRGYDVIVMDSRFELKSDINYDGACHFATISGCPSHGFREFASLWFDSHGEYLSYDPSVGLSLINGMCPSELPTFAKDVPTGVVLCYLVPSGLSPIAVGFQCVGCSIKYISHNRIDIIDHYHRVLLNTDTKYLDYFGFKAPYTLDFIQDVHIPILQNVVYFDGLEQMFLVFDRSVRINDVGAMSLLFSGNSTYTFDRTDIVGSSSGQVLRLNATAHNLSYTDAALVLQQDAFISTVDENNVYNSEAILPIIRVR